MKIYKLLLIIIIISLTYACNLRETARRKENLPKAKGMPGEIVMVMDSAEWEGELGNTVRSIFQQSVPGLPRDEPMFDLNYIDPHNFQSIFTTAKNIVFVTVLQSNNPGNRKLKTFFTKESLQKIAKDSSIFMFPKEDEFARGQQILHLFGETEQQLIQNLVDHRDELQDFFNSIVQKRTYNMLYNGKPETGIINRIKDKFGVYLKVPYGYEIAMDENKFIWIRAFTPQIDKNLFISYVDYTSKEQFSLDSLVNIRERIVRPYVLYKPEDPDSYMVTETKYQDVLRQEINFNGNYAVQLKGLWKLHKFTMGGPFISYAMVDESTNRLYYIEGFLYSPGIDQRENLRQLDVILNTFKLSAKQPS